MNRRGSAAVLAMIFLVVFSALACAFYVSVSAAMTVGYNDADSVHARASAESGMEYVKHAISKATISGKINATSRLSALATNMGLTSTGGNRIDLPRMNLSADGNRYFDAVIVSDDGEVLNVVVTGYYESPTNKKGVLRREIAAQFRSEEVGKDIFGFDAGSAGSASFSNAEVQSIFLNGAQNRANILAAQSQEGVPAIVLDGAQVNGGLGVVLDPSQVEINDRGQINVDGATSESAIRDNVALSDLPSFNDYDTERYTSIPGAPLTVVPQNTSLRGSTYENISIGGNVTFRSGTSLSGIIYVRAGSNITFQGSVTLNGIIVVEQGALSSVTMGGSFSCIMDPSAPGLSAAARTAISDTQGLAILAPTATFNMAGSGDFSANGSVVVNKFSMTNSGSDLTIRNGSLLTLSPDSDSLVLEQGTVTFIHDELRPPTKGVIWSRKFKMLTATYEEVVP